MKIHEAFLVLKKERKKNRKYNISLIPRYEVNVIDLDNVIYYNIKNIGTLEGEKYVIFSSFTAGSQSTLLKIEKEGKKSITSTSCFCFHHFSPDI